MWKDGRTSAVLFLSRDWAGWYGPGPDGRPALGRAKVLGAAPDDLAKAAVEAIANSGGKARPCVLALGSGMVSQRLMALPDLRRGELRSVFGRKAAAMIDGEPKDVLFAALPMEGEAAADGEAQERRWLILAQDRNEAIDLRLALRNRRVKVRRVVVSRLARLCRAQEVRGDPHEVCVVIDVTHQAVVTSLITADVLAQQSSIEGDYVGTPAMTMHVVQEVRGLDAFWRRTHRGGRVGQVVVIGLDPERARALGQAISSTLPDADVITLPPVEEGQELAPETGSQAAMAACSSTGPFNVDLTVHVPARHSYVLTLAACLLLVTVGLGSILHARLSRTLTSIEERARFFAFEARDLDHVVARNQAAVEAVEGMNVELERLLEAGAVGIPLEECLRDGLAAFGADATVTSLTIGPDEDGGEVAIAGVTGSHPVRAMQVLDGIGRRLEESPRFELIEIEPPAAVTPDVASITFVATGWREGAP